MKKTMAVLIPVYNEECVIAKTIETLISTGFQNKDIYIVDDQSTDNTANIARESGVNVHTVAVNGGKAKAQIEALRTFNLCDHYEWIVLLDGDTKVTQDFKSALMKAIINDPTVALYVGQVVSDHNNHIFSASRAYEYTFGQEISKKGQDNFNVIFVSPGCASMYRSDILRKLDIDNMTLAEDMDLTIQVHRMKEKIKYIHDAQVITQDPQTLKDYNKQISRWYRGFWQVIMKHKIFGFCKKQPIDLYMMYLAIEFLFFNKVFFFILGTSMFTLKSLPIFLFGDMAIFILVALFVSLKTKRYDVLMKSPLLYFISYLNLYAFLKSFVEIILLQKEILVWNKVKRYSFGQ